MDFGGFCNGSHHVWAKVNGSICNGLMGSSSMARVIDQRLGSCVVGYDMGEVIVRGPFLVGVNKGVTRLTMGSPIVRRLAHVQNSFSLEDSVAPLGGSTSVGAILGQLHTFVQQDRSKTCQESTTTSRLGQLCMEVADFYCWSDSLDPLRFWCRQSTEANRPTDKQTTRTDRHDKQNRQHKQKRQMDGQMDGRMDGRMNGRMDGEASK